MGEFEKWLLVAALAGIWGFPLRADGAGPEWRKTIEQAKVFLAHEDYGRAQVAARQAFIIAQNQLDPDHPDVVGSLSLLANAYFHGGQYLQAKPLLEKVLAARRRQATRPDPVLPPIQERDPELFPTE